MNFYLKDIEKLAILAYQKDATLIIYLTPPDFPVHPITCISPLKKISPLFDKYYFHKSCSYPSKIYFERIAKIESGLDLIQKKYKSNFKILKSYDIVCSQEICSPIRSGNSLYRDDDHPGNYFFKKLEPRVRELIKIKSLPKKL